MNPTVTTSAVRGHLLRSDIRKDMAKAQLRKAEIADWRERVGAAIERARLLRGWSLKELADAVKRDERQCARWINGSERPQLDALFAVDCFRPSLVIALSELGGDSVEVTTQIIVRRSA